MQINSKEMKKLFIYRTIMLLIIIVLSTNIISNTDSHVIKYNINIEPIYDNIWGSIYHAEVRQCDATPTITGDKSKINPYKASEYRWIAISQEMLNCKYRMHLLNDSTSILYKGKIEYGDTVWIESPYETINGWWIVHDTKNKRYQNSIDFLQTKDDSNLYGNDPMWNGRFDNIKIFKFSDIKKFGLYPTT